MRSPVTHQDRDRRNAGVLDHPREPSMVKGLVAGLVGGLAAAWVMDRVETARRSLSDADASAPRLQAEQERGSARGAPREQSEDSTVKVARLITRRVVG